MQSQSSSLVDKLRKSIPGSKVVQIPRASHLSHENNPQDYNVLPFRAALESGEAKRRFDQYFEIEEIAKEAKRRGWPRGYAVYLMTRKGDES